MSIDSGGMTELVSVFVLSLRSDPSKGDIYSVDLAPSFGRVTNELGSRKSPNHG